MDEQITYTDLFRKEKLNFWRDNDHVYFQFRLIIYGYAVDAYHLTSEQKTLITNLLDVVNRPRYALQVETLAGYASRTGTEAHNMHLSEQRVDALFTFIHTYFSGVATGPAMLSGVNVQKLGDTVLEVDTDHEEYYNRRTEMIYSINVKLLPPTSTVLCSKKWILGFNQSVGSSLAKATPKFGLGGEIGVGEIEILPDEEFLTTAQYNTLTDAQKKRGFQYLSLGFTAEISVPVLSHISERINKLIAKEMKDYLDQPIDVVSSRLEYLAPLISAKLGQIIGNASASIGSGLIAGSTFESNGKIDFLIPMCFEDFEDSLFNMAKIELKINIIGGGSLALYILGFYPLSKILEPGLGTLDTFSKAVAYSWCFGWSTTFDPIIIKMDTGVYISPVGTIFHVEN